MDAADNLYGTTFGGGDSACILSYDSNGWGMVYRLDTSRKETVLHAFTGPTDGADPNSGLVRDAARNLYGTTLGGGGSTNASCAIYSGCGVVFKADTTGKETILYSFMGAPDGGFPGSLILGSARDLYGATGEGGAGDCMDGNDGLGCGTVFKVNISIGAETILYSFAGGTDGMAPDSVTRDAAGDLYGTTQFGGNTVCENGDYLGCGTIFEVNTTGKETILHRFVEIDGRTPSCWLAPGPIGGLVRYGLRRHRGREKRSGVRGQAVVEF
jgi:uncharacterized repeat protein (TIGR03803 family)